MAPVSKHLKNIGVVSLLTVCSRVLGLMRDQLGAAVFGASVLNSAFLTAFRLPNLFRRLLGEGSLTAAFLPTLQEELHVNGRPGAFTLLNKVVTWLTVITGTLVALAMVVFSHSRALPGREFKWYLAADLTVLLFPYLLFVCLAAIFSAVGILGGYVVGVLLIGVDAGAFWSQMQGGVDVWADVGNGVIKSIVFGFAVTFTALYQGYEAKPTPEGVSRATTKTVVYASLAVLGLDFLLTALMFS